MTMKKYDVRLRARTNCLWRPGPRPGRSRILTCYCENNTDAIQGADEWRGRQRDSGRLYRDTGAGCDACCWLPGKVNGSGVKVMRRLHCSRVLVCSVSQRHCITHNRLTGIARQQQQQASSKSARKVNFHQSTRSTKMPAVDGRGVARNLIWVGINWTISNLCWVKETKQPHKNF